MSFGGERRFAISSRRSGALGMRIKKGNQDG
jgi:hypothetical protein